MTYGLEIFTGLEESQIGPNTTTMQIAGSAYRNPETSGDLDERESGTISFPRFDSNRGFIATQRGGMQADDIDYSWDNSTKVLSYDMSVYASVNFVMILTG